MNDRPLTDEELDAIEARASAATPGPWHVHVAGPFSRVVGMDENGNLPWGWETFGEYPDPNEANDAVFMAHARADVPRLAAEVRRLRGAIQRGEAPPDVMGLSPDDVAELEQLAEQALASGTRRVGMVLTSRAFVL